MARYFFDISSGGYQTRDAEGEEHDTLRGAQDEAVSALLEMARMPPPVGDQCTMALLLRDEAGDVVCRATLSLKVERSG